MVEGGKKRYREKKGVKNNTSNERRNALPQQTVAASLKKKT